MAKIVALNNIWMIGGVMNKWMMIERNFNAEILLIVMKFV
jgi:hypothetical protein